MQQQQQHGHLVESSIVLLVVTFFYVVIFGVHEARETVRVAFLVVGSFIVVHTVVFLFPNGPTQEQSLLARGGLAAVSATAIRSCYFAIRDVDPHEPRRLQLLRLTAAGIQGIAFATAFLSSVFHTRQQVDRNGGLRTWRDARVAFAIAGYTRICIILMMRSWFPEANGYVLHD